MLWYDLLMTHLSKSLLSAAFVVAWLVLGMDAACRAEEPVARPGETVVLSSGPWPPYAGQDIPSQGATIAVARAAFAAVGVELQVRFYPWRRAVYEAAYNPEVAGYLPEYYSDRLGAKWLFSDPMGWGPIYFMAPSGSGFDWQTLDDLAGKTIGVVAGYVNEKELDRRIASGIIQGTEVVDDATLIRMVAHGRFDAAIIDPYVYYDLIAKDELAGLRKQITIHPRPLTEHSLHLCFKDTVQGRRLQVLFNRGLALVDVRAIQDEYLFAHIIEHAWPAR